MNEPARAGGSCRHGDRVVWVDPYTGQVEEFLDGFSFTMSTVDTHWAGVDVTPDGNTVIVTDRGAQAIYVFGFVEELDEQPRRAAHPPDGVELIKIIATDEFVVIDHRIERLRTAGGHPQRRRVTRRVGRGQFPERFEGPPRGVRIGRVSTAGQRRRSVSSAGSRPSLCATTTST